MIELIDSQIRTITDTKVINKLIKIRGKLLHKIELSKLDVNFLKEHSIF